MGLITDRGENAKKSRGEGTHKTGGGERGEEAGGAKDSHPKGVWGRTREEETEGNGGEELKKQSHGQGVVLVFLKTNVEQEVTIHSLNYLSFAPIFFSHLADLLLTGSQSSPSLSKKPRMKSWFIWLNRGRRKQRGRRRKRKRRKPQYWGDSMRGRGRLRWSRSVNWRLHIIW